MKTILIDDEELAVKGLRKLLRQYDDVFEVVAVASNGREAVELIEFHQPDLIFLDIEMPVYNGFEVLKRLTNKPLIVFTTAYNAFAVRAFEENSLDYLLKPIEKQRFDITVERLQKQWKDRKNDFDSQKLIDLMDSLHQKKEIHSLTVKLGDRIIFVPIAEITHFFAEERYVILNTVDGKQHLINQTIQTLEERLPRHFVRVSRSSIVNFNHIREAQKFFGGKYILFMKDPKKSKIETGSKYVENLTKLLDL